VVPGHSHVVDFASFAADFEIGLVVLAEIADSVPFRRNAGFVPYHPLVA